MLSPQTHNFTKLMKAFISGEITGDEFFNDLDNLYYEMTEESDFAAEENKLLNRLHFNLDLFESDDKIRAASPSSIDEAELRRRTKMILEELLAMQSGNVP
jgi:hypothetical protein